MQGMCPRIWSRAITYHLLYYVLLEPQQQQKKETIGKRLTVNSDGRHCLTAAALPGPASALAWVASQPASKVLAILLQPHPNRIRLFLFLLARCQAYLYLPPPSSTSSEPRDAHIMYTYEWIALRFVVTLITNYHVDCAAARFVGLGPVRVGRQARTEKEREQTKSSGVVQQKQQQQH